MLRDAVRGLAPTSVLDRRDKVGYEPPQSAWLVEPAWRARIAEVMLTERARHRGLYRGDMIEADLRAGRWRDAMGIWRAFNLELWLETFSLPTGRTT